MSEPVAMWTMHTPAPSDWTTRTQLHELTLFRTVGAMLDLIGSDAHGARRRCWIETYIYRHDRLATAFADLLATAASRGCDVRLLYDPLGCNETDPQFFDRMRSRGIAVQPYRPQDVVHAAGHWGPRDHTRIIVLDDVAYTGGAAWGDEWLPRERGGQGWHDVCLRVRGPVVADFARAFSRRWNEASGNVDGAQSIATRDQYPDLEFVADTPGGSDRLVDRYCRRIERARSRIWLENAYFFGTAEVLHALAGASRRGVDVKIILPKTTDLPILKNAALAECAQWMAAGLQVFEYGPSILHSKFAVIDDDWATVGTLNLNVTSLMFSNEAGVIVFDREFVATAARLFQCDLAQCTRVSDERLRSRSVASQVRDRFAEAALALLEWARIDTG